MFKMVLMRFFESYFRHRWLFLLPVILMIGAGAFYFYVTPRKYIAQSVIYVQKQSLLASLNSINTPGFTWLSASQITANEIKELIQTDSFVRAVVQKTDLEANMKNGPVAVNETIDEVRKSTWVITAGDNQIIIGATFEYPKVAAQLVNGIFDSYIDWKINTANTDSEVAQNFFTTLTPTYKNNLESIRKELLDYLTTHPEPARGNRPDVQQVEVERIRSDLQLASTRYADALNKLENAKLVAAQNEKDIRQNYTMVDSPEIPDKPSLSLKKMLINSLVFVMVGILVSICAVLGGAVLDRSFRFPLDVQQAVHLPVLALIPDKTIKDKRKLALFKKTRSSQPKLKPMGNEEKKETTGAGEWMPETEMLLSDPELYAKNIDADINV